MCAWKRVNGRVWEQMLKSLDKGPHCATAGPCVSGPGQDAVLTVSWPSTWWTLGKSLTLRVVLKDMANTKITLTNFNTHGPRSEKGWAGEAPCAGQKGLVRFPRTGLGRTGQIVSLPKSSWACLFVRVCLWACSQTNRSQWQESVSREPTSSVTRRLCTHIHHSNSSALSFVSRKPPFNEKWLAFKAQSHDCVSW